MLTLDLSRLPPGLRIGTSSFSTSDWCGVFYPKSLPPAEFLSFYAGQMRTVEIDATWHVMPSVRTVQAWARKVPDGFLFSAKVPKEITHECYLEGCEEEWNLFLKVMDELGEKKGPLLFQFPYVPKGKDPEEYATGADFRRRLERFLPLVPEGGRYAIEIRNEKWITEPLLDLLRARGISLALIAYYTMPSGRALMKRLDPVTADFGYIRFLGHHGQMDEEVARAREEGRRLRDWDTLMQDRTGETREWIPAIEDLLRRQTDVFVYFNNHYAGFAPGSIDLFVRLWEEEAKAREAAAPPTSL